MVFHTLAARIAPEEVVLLPAAFDGMYVANLVLFRLAIALGAGLPTSPPVSTAGLPPSADFPPGRKREKEGNGNRSSSTFYWTRPRFLFPFPVFRRKLPSQAR